MIVFTIKSFFFSETNSYSLRQKPHIFHFFLFFHRKMIKVVYAMFAIVIEDPEICLDNPNLSLEKTAIWFEPLA